MKSLKSLELQKDALIEYHQNLIWSLSNDELTNQELEALELKIREVGNELEDISQVIEYEKMILS